MTAHDTTTVLPEGVENEVAPLGGGATSAPPACTCPEDHGYAGHLWSCPLNPRPGKVITRDQWFNPAVLRSRRDEDDHDPDGRMADAEAARVYGGRDAD